MARWATSATTVTRVLSNDLNDTKRDGVMAHRHTLPWSRGSGPFKYGDFGLWAWHCTTCHHMSDHVFQSKKTARWSYTNHVQRAHEGCLP